MKWDDRIGRRLKLRDLHIFLAVAQQGSMGKAAKLLSVSQPVVSKAITDMEHTLKVRLLDRAARGVEPTIYGSALLRWGAVVFDDLRQTVKEIEFLADPTAGELRIGATAPMSVSLLPAIMDGLSRRHPRICFHVSELPATPAHYDALRDRHVELIIGRMPRRTADDDIDSEILFQEKLHVVAGLQSSWNRRRKLALAELVDVPWCLPPIDGIAGSLIADAFRLNGLKVPAAVVTCISFQLFISMVATGRYLSMWPSSVVHFRPERVGVTALPVNLGGQQSWPLAISMLKNRTINPVAKLFIECAREIVRPLAKIQK